MDVEDLASHFSFHALITSISRLDGMRSIPSPGRSLPAHGQQLACAIGLRKSRRSDNKERVTEQRKAEDDQDQATANYIARHDVVGA